ncbi:MAG: FtsX-like permease family protein, partial [Chlamydiae bacterium]|nr:FtsX-like permease family protein [Chlamydiota bacterium]
VDSVSENSNFQNKTIGEKATSSFTDPYDNAQDCELPLHFSQKDLSSDGTLKDPVKIAYGILQGLKDKKEIQSFQDFEMSGALLKLQLLRTDSPLFTARGSESINFLSQVAYISSFPSENPALSSLIIPPSIKDINHLLYLASNDLEGNRAEGSPSIKRTASSDFAAKIFPILENARISSVKTALPFWKMPISLLPEGIEFSAIGYLKGATITQIVLSEKKSHSPSQETIKGMVKKEKGILYFTSDGKKYLTESITPIYSEEILHFAVNIDKASLETAQSGKDLLLKVKTKLQGQTLEGIISWDALEVESCKPVTTFTSHPPINPLWTYSTQKSAESAASLLPVNYQRESGILLPKGFQDNGVLIGDRGYLAYTASSASSIQEQRLPIYIAGFYDPGIMSVGNKCLLAPREITRAINAASTSHSFDKIALNGMQVWFSDLSKTESLKKEIQTAFEENGIDSYWEVSSYKDYDFAKELLQQFQSDKYLFSLIAIIIITVACCNIISLLVLLVNDKKKEIGILLSMGAKPQSIALIFGSCGVVMGTLGCIIGCLAAYLTMHNIDGLVHLLSSMQGHDAFSAVFYGSSLPSTLSPSSVFFVIVSTPILALIAGLIPAIKACGLKPSSILRSE